MLMKQKTYICVAAYWFVEKAHFESITKYIGFFQFSHFWLYKRKPKAQFKAEKAIQTTQKIRKSIPDNLK